MIVEFWDKSESTERVFGLARLPLHQFYLGYRNSVILQHLKRNKLPIIGTDWWEPVYSVDKNELIGQVQVLTALGTDEQISNLQLERGFKDDIVKSKLTQPTLSKKFNSNTLTNNITSINRKAIKPVRKRIITHINHPGIENPKQVEPNQKVDVGIQSDSKMESKAASNSPHMFDTLNSFIKLLESSQKPHCVENSTNTDPSISTQASTQLPEGIQSPQLRKTSDLLDSLHKALNINTSVPKKTETHFKAEILINGANQLPSRRKLKGKSKKTKRKSGKQEENILPSTYVTFETVPGETLRFTSVFPKSTTPKWNFKCEICLPMDFITNDQKRLIFKVWKKSTNAVLQPNIQTDLVLGFAALDLSVLGLGFPNVQGWFNIIDFSGKCNGQINVHVNPLEKINITNVSSASNVPVLPDSSTQNLQVSLEQPETDECNELLGRALKRKFTELDEITQRLRLRLSAVVSEDSDGSNDDMTEEFENDINNLCVEDDFDLINFEEEARKFNTNYSNQKAEQKSKTQSLGPLSVETQPCTSDQKVFEGNSQLVGSDTARSSKESGLLIEQSESEGSSESTTSRSTFGEKSLIQGKHRIDSLLEKLTLLASETSQPFSSRYVSGCSVLTNDQNDIQDIFKDLEQHSRPNITATSDFNHVMFQQLYGGSASVSSKENHNTNEEVKVKSSCDSEGSGVTNLSECRPNPDGQGNGEDDKE